MSPLILKKGVTDQVGGKIDNVIGAITGDSAQELAGKARLEKGSAQQSVSLFLALHLRC